MKIATIIGARPQFIKAAAINRAIKKQNIDRQKEVIHEVLIHTGQHYDTNMSQIFFDELNIPCADYHLGIGGTSHGAMTGRMLEKIEEVLGKERPDWVLVYGDTNSTLAGALAAVKMSIPVAHVEAGLRSFNRKMPEEINRILADQCAEKLYTPTDAATKQLLKEGVSANKIHQVGDVMYDVSLYYRRQAQEKSHILQKLQLCSKGYALATVHRQENTDDPQRLEKIFQGLVEISRIIPVIMPLHPRTKQVLEKLKIKNIVESKINLIDPIGYLDMIQLESAARTILTDSGGVQKEAFFFQVPCLILRNETEWVELVEHGFNQLVPLDPEMIFSAFQNCQDEVRQWDILLYGEGNASNKIASILSSGC